jgi:hypothetical protein
MLDPSYVLPVETLVGRNPPPVQGLRQGAVPLSRASIIELAIFSVAGLIF